jgi:hypothetical protein
MTVYQNLKRILSLLLSLTLLLAFVPEGSAALYTGTCGENVTWEFGTDTGVLTISGTGPMANWGRHFYSPWYAFREFIKEVRISNGVTTIGDSAFLDCTSLASVVIPDSVTRIGMWAFHLCTSLASVVIGSNMIEIDPWAFYGCTSLVNISVDKVNSIFSSENGVLFNKNKTTLHQYPAGKTDTTYIIPDSVTIIGEAAFAGCAFLTSMTIPDKVTSIDEYAFHSCMLLTNVTIPKSVTKIGRMAFHYVGMYYFRNKK